jgi:hypothetical protein
MRNVPEGWTDDFNFPMASGRTVEELVDYVLQAAIQRYTNSTVIQKLISDFGLTEADAGFALDRALGGVVRAATGPGLKLSRERKRSRCLEQLPALYKIARPDCCDLSAIFKARSQIIMGFPGAFKQAQESRCVIVHDPPSFGKRLQYQSEQPAFFFA